MGATGLYYFYLIMFVSKIWMIKCSAHWKFKEKKREIVFVNFIYSEKATKFFEIFTLYLSYVVPVKKKVMKKNVAS